MVGQALLVGFDVDEGATGLPASTILDRVLRHLQHCTIGTCRRRLSLPAINVVYRPLIRTLAGLPSSNRPRPTSVKAP